MRRPAASNAAANTVLEAPAREAAGQQQRRRKAEGLAREALKAGDISAQAVQRALEAAVVPLSSSRKNVMPVGTTQVQGMVLGLFVFGANIGISLASRACPQLTRLLAAYAQKERPEFPFTSIQVNVNYASRPHVDRNNLGMSLIRGIGTFKGGELWVHEEGGSVDFTLEEDINQEPLYRRDSTWPGRDVDIRDRWYEFNGNRLHFTRPFVGARFSLVYFACDRLLEAPETVRRELATAGFGFRWREVDLQRAVALKRDARLEQRAELEQRRRQEIREERERLGRCLARTWNRGWAGACPLFRKPGLDFCESHAKGTWRTHGRLDGPIPLAKQEEMAKWQRILLGKGEKPPCGAFCVGVLLAEGDRAPPGPVVLVPLPPGASVQGAQAWPEAAMEAVPEAAHGSGAARMQGQCTEGQVPQLEAAAGDSPAVAPSVGPPRKRRRWRSWGNGGPKVGGEPHPGA